MNKQTHIHIRYTHTYICIVHTHIYRRYTITYTINIYIHTYTYIQKALISIATTLKCRGGHYSFFWIALLDLDPYLIMLSVKQGGIKYHFLSL